MSIQSAQDVLQTYLDDNAGEMQLHLQLIDVCTSYSHSTLVVHVQCSCVDVYTTSNKMSKKCHYKETLIIITSSSSARSLEALTITARRRRMSLDTASYCSTPCNLALQDLVLCKTFDN